MGTHECKGTRTQQQSRSKGLMSPVTRPTGGRRGRPPKGGVVRNDFHKNHGGAQREDCHGLEIGDGPQAVGNTSTRGRQRFSAGEARWPSRRLGERYRERPRGRQQQPHGRASRCHSQMYTKSKNQTQTLRKSFKSKIAMPISDSGWVRR